LKTEILATIGPASIDIIDRLYDNGLSGIRINSSHGAPGDHLKAIERSKKFNPGGYIVYDIKGPKVRLGDIPEPLKIKAGDRILLRTDIPRPADSDYPKVEGFDQGIPVTVKIDEFAREGDRFFVDDGYIGLKTLKVGKGRIECEVMYGDVIRSRKGLNHPDTIISFPYTMPQDIPNLDFAIKNGVNFIADSFTRNGDDVKELRGRLEGSGIKIISKIENPEGVNNFDDILKCTDSVMVARGDLGVELDPWALPELQKVMIEKCNTAGKPVVTATQMLESMIENPHPSRADVSDIANAIYDGTDVIMLSGESSIGKYPDKCVLMMRKIAESVEAAGRYRTKQSSNNGLASLLRK
jgi:pyruvate kinase